MATPFDDGSAHGATSMDRADVPSCRPETRHHRHSVLGRPVALAVDETAPAVHRSRRYRTAHAPQVSEERMGSIASTAFAVVSLVFVSVVALGSMLMSATILHLAYPNRRFDDFRVLHEPAVLDVLCGLAVLWLLPSHPWATEPKQSEPKKRRLISSEGGGVMAPVDSQASPRGSCRRGSPALSGRSRKGRRRPSPTREAVVLRFWQAGHSRPVWPHQRGAASPPCNTRGPPVLGPLGDVLIHRPSLVAWPVGSEWRSRRPDIAINQPKEHKQMNMKRFMNKKVATIGLAVGLALGAAGAAFAYFTTSADRLRHRKRRDCWHCDVECRPSAPRSPATVGADGRLSRRPTTTPRVPLVTHGAVGDTPLATSTGPCLPGRHQRWRC